MRGSSLTAPLEVEKVQHAPFSVDLLPSEATGPYVQLVAATEEPADPMRHVRPHGLVGLLGRPEAEVFGPSLKQTVEPGADDALVRDHAIGWTGPPPITDRDHQAAYDHRLLCSGSAAARGSPFRLARSPRDRFRRRRSRIRAGERR